MDNDAYLVFSAFLVFSAIFLFFLTDLYLGAAQYAI